MRELTVMVFLAADRDSTLMPFKGSFLAVPKGAGYHFHNSRRVTARHDLRS